MIGIFISYGKGADVKRLVCWVYLCSENLVQQDGSSTMCGPQRTNWTNTGISHIKPYLVTCVMQVHLVVYQIKLIFLANQFMLAVSCALAPTNAASVAVRS